MHFYFKEFLGNRNRSVSLQKAKVYIIPVGKPGKQEKWLFPHLLYNRLLFSSPVVCWHYIICLLVLESTVNMVQNMTIWLSLDSIHPNRMLINLVLFREAVSFVLFNFLPCLGIKAMLIFNRLKLIIICNIHFCYHCF